MKTTVLALSMVLLTGASLAQGKLSVVVKNVKDTQGQVRVGLFKDDKTFLKEAWKGEVVKAATGEVRVVFENIPAGTYAISIIHDENENGELDSNFFGIPKEGFGFSNDAMGTFGPPDFAKASFSLKAGEHQVAVSMRYM